ncbi:MAG: hypothetical protein J0M01_01575 [Dechloromonas sp.]|jgi:hypothetical protein|nr:hypothetical protein [Dechloromonas sp.]
MGFGWNGVCYPDAPAALEAFALDVPSSDSGGVNAFVGMPSISGGGLVSWSIVKIPFGGDAVTSTGTTQLQACNEGVEQWPVQSLLLVVALFFAAFSGFRTGYRP